MRTVHGRRCWDPGRRTTPAGRQDAFSRTRMSFFFIEISLEFDCGSLFSTSSAQTVYNNRAWPCAAPPLLLCLSKKGQRPVGSDEARQNRKMQKRDTEQTKEEKNKDTQNNTVSMKTPCQDDEERTGQDSSRQDEQRRERNANQRDKRRWAKKGKEAQKAEKKSSVYVG